MKIGLFSGGKDSLVACHLMQNELNGVLYCKTGIGIPENFEYVKQTCKKLNWKLNIVEPKETETYENFVKKFGFPHAGIHSVIMGYLKYHPMRKWAKTQAKKDNNIIFISGWRKAESKRRMRTIKKAKTIMEGMTFLSPIANWTNSQVWNYIKKNNLEISPVYKTMHLSGDCLCGAFSELGESELLATFHKELAEEIAKLEKKYHGRWGNQSSMTGAMKQSKISNFICADCIISGNH